MPLPFFPYSPFPCSLDRDKKGSETNLYIYLIVKSSDKTQIRRESSKLTGKNELQYLPVELHLIRTLPVPHNPR